MLEFQRVMEDLQRKGDDMDRVVDLSQDLQSLLSVSLNYYIIILRKKYSN